MSGPDQVLAGFLRLSGVVTGSVLLLIVCFLVIRTLPALQEPGPGELLGDTEWRPDQDAARGEFGLLAMLAGSAAVTAVAVLLAGPVGVACAVSCRFFAGPRTRSVLRCALQLMAGVPSVLFGLWGLERIVPLVRALQPPGASLLAGGVVLALMILPTVALLVEAALREQPREWNAASAALGLRRTTRAFRVALPAARGAVASALLLAMARALGETMAVLMVCGNVVRMPGSLFEPVRTLTANIALELGYATGTHRSALFASGLSLVCLASVLVACAALLRRRSRHAS